MKFHYFEQFSLGRSTGTIYQILFLPEKITVFKVNRRGRSEIGSFSIRHGIEAGEKTVFFEGQIHERRGLVIRQIARRALSVFHRHNPGVKVKGMGAWHRGEGKRPVVRSHEQIEKILAGHIQGSGKKKRPITRRKK